MTSLSSKSIPFIVLAIVAITLATEVVYDMDIDVEAFIPVLTAMGVSGAAIKIVKDASAAKKAIPENVRDIVKGEIAKAIPNKEPI